MLSTLFILQILVDYRDVEDERFVDGSRLRMFVINQLESLYWHTRLKEKLMFPSTPILRPVWF